MGRKWCWMIEFCLLFPSSTRLSLPPLYSSGTVRYFELVLTSTFCLFHPLLFLFYFHFFLVVFLPLLVFIKAFLLINFVWLPLPASFARAHGTSCIVLIFLSIIKIQDIRTVYLFVFNFRFTMYFIGVHIFQWPNELNWLFLLKLK